MAKTNTIETKQAHNIAASLIFPEHTLLKEIRDALGEPTISDKVRRIAYMACSNARKAIEDTLVDMTK